MRPAGDLDLARDAQAGAPLPYQPFGEGRIEGSEDRVARDGGQHAMEGKIGGLETLHVAGRGSVGLERQAQLAQVLLGGAFGGIAGEPRLEKLARLLEIADTVGLRQHDPGSPGNGVEHHLRRRPRHQRALARPDLHHPHLGEVEQSLAHRGATHPEFAHQVPLRWQLLPGRIDALQDAELQAVGNLFVELLGLDGRVEQHWHTCYTSTTVRPARPGRQCGIL